MSGREDVANEAARLAAQCRQREAEIFEMAVAITDPDARRHLLFILESYGRMAEREEERAERLRHGM